MGRMNGPKRKKIYEALVHRDGECCYIGGEKGSPETLVIDHLDNNPRNNVRKNLHLLCRRANHVKNPRGRGRKQSSLCVGERMDMLEAGRTSSAEMAKNWQSEPDFRHWMFAEVWRKERLDLDEAINCGAAVARCSQETIKRYIKKETSRIRPYQIIEDQETKKQFIVFHSDWERARNKEEEKRILNAQANNWTNGIKKGAGLDKPIQRVNIEPDHSKNMTEGRVPDQ